ncbi:RNase adaptor protein RapZ [Enterovibrio norvegicus FF-454]|uniref:RNase adaptor protein RapZ n=1 Tax=Enterovibrio norvegicus FF-454 TaxID=1185651 RepID=A0A1E5BXH5_9GAMM|nr:RNase adapter RapZ [Enterovibrio norvegicus]OEE57957.1 RNase adaptor protein RapZ [Enterovibrio norvegicus FF-454]
MQLKIVSGRSGSGKSVALRVLEDLGYYCVDNLPVDLLPQFVAAQNDDDSQIAVSIDIRNMPADPEEITQTLAQLPDDVDVDIFFLDADDNELVKRFSETRRLHPLSRDNLSLEQAIDKEKQLLTPLKERADKVINTSKHSIHDLSEAVRALVLGRTNRDLVMVFESFGFKHGLPSDADFVFDVRFLPNPHWEPALRPLTGLDEPVKMFLAAEQDVAMLIAQVKSFLESWLPALEKNNRSYLTVAIGCTGGQHRSVYIAQFLADYFAAHNHQVQIRHRTLEGKI